MREDKKMNAHVTKSGYKYYTPQKVASEAPQAPRENKWKKGIQWIRQAFLAGLRNLPGLIMKAAVLMVTTPLMILLFIFNLLKSLLVTAIGWFVFKVVVVLLIAAAFTAYEALTKHSVASGYGIWLDGLYTNFVFPQGVPIYHWWETTIIVVLAVITALSLTFYSDEV